MKSDIGKYFSLMLMSVFLSACASTNQHITAQGIEFPATTNANNSENKKNYDALANQHERLARQMQTKAQEQKKIFKRLSHSIYFSKNKWSKKAQAAYKFRKYQRVSEENFKKGVYYRKLSKGQFAQKSMLKKKQTGDQKNNGLSQIIGASYLSKETQTPLK